MQGSCRKAEAIPLKFSMLVMWSTLLIYVLGPIRWIQEWDFAEIITILLLVCYFFAFAFGYDLCRGTISRSRAARERIARSKKWMKILSITIYINFFLTVGNALLYGGAANVSELVHKAMQGLASPSTVYYSKDASSRAGSLIVWITFAYSPMMYITSILSIVRFGALSKIKKACVVATLLIEVLRWLSVGTNKGLFDIVLLFLTYYLILRMMYYGNETEHTRKNRRKIRRIMLAVIVLAALFFAFFGSAISSRVGGIYNESNYLSFPYNMIPEGLRFLVEKMDSYLVQGYDNLEKIIENCNFQWTFGIGNSRFLMDVMKRLVGIDITGRTYPYQLGAYGVDPLASWHSAYAWFAGDLTFIGIIFLMFIAGYYMCCLARDVIYREDPISMALLYLMIMMVTNASCTNYVLAYTNGFWGFWGLFIWRILNKRHIRIVLKGIKRDLAEKSVER